MAVAPGPYPLTYNVEPQLTNRNRKTVALRLIWAFPHLLIVGTSIAAPFGLFAISSYALNGGDSTGGWQNYSVSGGGGLAGAALTMAVVAWFAIMFAHNHPRGLWDFANYYMRWRAYVNAYFLLLRDDYPPFGAGEYASVQLTIADQPEDAARKLIGWRLIAAIPQIIVLAFVGIAAVFVAIVSWISIVFTGSMPESQAKFLAGYVRWSMRLEGYILLMYDEYPPYSLD